MTYTSTQLQFLECIYWKSCLQTQTSLTDPQNAHRKGSLEACGVIHQRAYHEQVPRSIQFPAPKHEEGSENVLSKQVHLYSFRPLDQLSHGFFLWIKKENSETIFFSSHIWNLRSFGSLSCKRNPSEPLHTLQSNFSAKLFGVFGLVLWQNRGLNPGPAPYLRATCPTPSAAVFLNLLPLFNPFISSNIEMKAMDASIPAAMPGTQAFKEISGWEHPE